MSHASATARLLTELDHRRIDLLLTRNDAQRFEELHALLDDADVVPAPEVPNDVVTMYTKVVVEDPDGSNRRQLTLCYPNDAQPTEGLVSVLSPIGAALLGRRRGDDVTWITPTGATQRLRIVELVFQPEANGDYSM
ncbi:MAG: nucleoside diphosphate kinase regulator [Burkholderiaceae bacterium]